MFKKIKAFIELVVPFYGFVMLMIVFGFNCLTYFGTRIFTENLYHHTLNSKLDQMIPFNSYFVIFYTLAYVQWILGFIMIARQEKTFCYRYLTGEMIAKFLCLLCFVFYPTTIARSSYEAIVANGTGFCDWVTNFIYTADAPNNLFPSIHCLESYVCVRTAFAMTNIKHKKAYIIGNIIMAACVFASTVFLKQHVVADMFGAIFVVEVGFAISGLLFHRKHNWKVVENIIHG